MNQLMKFAKHYIASDAVRPSFPWMQCEVNNTKIKAFCIEDHCICEVTLPIEEFEGEAGIYFLPPLNKRFVLKDGNIDVMIGEKEVTYQNKVFSQTFKVEQKQEIFPVKKIWKESCNKIHFQPKQLLEALQPFTNRDEPILIELIEKESFILTQTDGDCKYKALILGVKVK